MSNTIASLTVILKQGCTEEHAQRLMDAISIIIGVQAVKLGELEDIHMTIARVAAHQEISEKLWSALHDED